jgi:WhiB family redox-sensing transcriptional regulator
MTPVDRDPDNRDWLEAGRCRDYPAEVFFPSHGAGVEVARRICAGCPVREPCLAYALAHRITQGIWGGTSERQRRDLRRLPGVDQTSA